MDIEREGESARERERERGIKEYRNTHILKYRQRRGERQMEERTAAHNGRTQTD